jgi:hypothetical protein
MVVGVVDKMYVSEHDAHFPKRSWRLVGGFRIWAMGYSNEDVLVKAA